MSSSYPVSIDDQSYQWNTILRSYSFLSIDKLRSVFSIFLIVWSISILVWEYNTSWSIKVPHSFLYIISIIGMGNYIRTARKSDSDYSYSPDSISRRSSVMRSSNDLDTSMDWSIWISFTIYHRLKNWYNQYIVRLLNRILSGLKILRMIPELNNPSIHGGIIWSTLESLQS